MKVGRAFAAGVVGALVMSVLMALARSMGMQVNLEMMLGTMMGGPPSPTKWIMGFVMHLIIGGLWALVYAAGFEYLTHRASWAIGLGFALVHALIAGVFMGMMPAIHPLIPEMMPAPGAFMAHLGLMGVIAEFMLHLIYGAIVGAMYGPVVQRPFETRADAIGTGTRRH